MITVGKLTSIEVTLNEHLAGLVFAPVLPIAWPDVPFEPVAKYLVPSFLPNKTDRAGVGINAPRRHLGLYQVLVRGPLGQGAAVNSETADAIVEHFANQILAANGVRVRIGSFDGGPADPWRSSAIRQDTHSDVPVTIPWWCDAF